MQNALKELLRFHTSGSFFPKYATQDTEYLGQKIKRGDAVFISIASANKDESMFTNAETLDITRDTSNTLSFGHGINYCLGTQLALTVMSSIMNKLLDYLPVEAHLIPAEIKFEAGSRRAIIKLPINTYL